MWLLPERSWHCPYRLSNQHIPKRGFTQLGTLLNAKFYKNWTFDLRQFVEAFRYSMGNYQVSQSFSLCKTDNTLKDAFVWKTKKQKNLSDHKLDHHWWLGHPANSLFVGCSNRVCWWWDKVMDLDVAHHQGTPPGHTRAHRVHQGRAATTLIALVVGYDGANYRAGQ